MSPTCCKVMTNPLPVAYSTPAKWCYIIDPTMCERIPWCSQTPRSWLIRYSPYITHTNPLTCPGYLTRWHHGILARMESCTRILLYHPHNYFGGVEISRILDGIQYQALSMDQPNLRYYILPPLREHQTEASLVPKHLLESYETFRTWTSRRPGSFGRRVWIRTHGQLCDEWYPGNSNVSISIVIITCIWRQWFFVNSTNESMIGSNSIQGGVFDNAGRTEETPHDSFGTKTMVISPSVENVGEV